MRIDLHPRLRKSVRKLSAADRTQVADALSALLDGFGFPHLHSGLGIRRLRKICSSAAPGLRSISSSSPKKARAHRLRRDDTRSTESVAAKILINRRANKWLTTKSRRARSGSRPPNAIRLYQAFHPKILFENLPLNQCAQGRRNPLRALRDFVVNPSFIRLAQSRGQDQFQTFHPPSPDPAQSPL